MHTFTIPGQSIGILTFFFIYRNIPGGIKLVVIIFTSTKDIGIHNTLPTLGNKIQTDERFHFFNAKILNFH